MFCYDNTNIKEQTKMYSTGEGWGFIMNERDYKEPTLSVTLKGGHNIKDSQKNNTPHL